MGYLAGLTVICWGTKIGRCVLFWNVAALICDCCAFIRLMIWFIVLVGVGVNGATIGDCGRKTEDCAF